MSSNKAESKRNGVKRRGEEASSQDSSPNPKINTQILKHKENSRRISQNFHQISLKEPETKRSRAKRRREETSSQGSSTHPQNNTPTSKINTRSRKIHKSTRENKKKALLEEVNACGKCRKCACVLPPDERSEDLSCFFSSSFVSGDYVVSTSSESSVGSMETTAASKTNDEMFMDLLSYFYDNGKLNDEDLIKALKLFKEDTMSRNLWFRLKEHVQRQKPLLIVTEDIGSEALATLILNKICAGLKLEPLALERTGKPICRILQP